MIQAPTQAEARPQTKRAPRRWVAYPALPALVFLIVLVLVFSFTANGFLSPSNIQSIFAQVAVLGIIALAVNEVVLCADIDISVGSMLALCSLAVGAVSTITGGLLLPLLAGVLVGAAVGCINGFLVTIGRIPAIIVTLGMLYALRGLVLIITGGNWITGIPDATRALGIGAVGGVQFSVVTLLLLLVVMVLVSRYTTWGRDVFAVGGNRNAARLVGLPINRVRFLAFVLVGVFTGIASCVFLGRVGIVSTGAGNGLELQVVAAVVVGGTSIAGGRGSVVAAFIGAVLIGVILNGMVLLGVPGVWQNVVLGALILLAIATDAVRRRLIGGRS